MDSINTIISSIIVISLPLSAIIPETDIVCWDKYWWAYVDWIVYVCDFDENTEFYKQHEIAHYIWNKILTKEQKATYIKEYKKAKKIWIKAFYRAYWYRDAEEDFCDNYSLLKTKENSNPQVMKRIRLIKKFLIQ